MTRTVTELKPLLLALVASARPDPAASELDALSRQDWETIDEMAQQHRLCPWLHERARWADPPWPVPDPILQSWRRSYEAGAIGALTAKAAVVQLAAAFERAGIRMVALKGAQLAFFDYPSAALRPMRDIDILVAGDDLPAALSVMADLGCDVPDDRDAAVEKALREKHVDPILFPACNRHIELHHRIMSPQTRRGPFVPNIPTEAILGESRTRMLGGQAVHYPSAQHMLAHQILHAAYNHRFDCGPLALIDIAMLTGEGDFDWKLFQKRAEEAGYASGASLVLALVERHFGRIAGRKAQPVPDSVLALAENLILQNFETRDQVKLAVEATQGTGLIAAVIDRLSVGMTESGAEGRLRWLGRRALRTVRQGGDRRARSEAQAGRDLSQWLARKPNGET